MDCEEIKPGMDLSSTLTGLGRHGEPSLENFDNNKLTVERGLVTCSVEFDDSTNRVTKAHSVVHEPLGMVE